VGFLPFLFVDLCWHLKSSEARDKVIPGWFQVQVSMLFRLLMKIYVPPIRIARCPSFEKKLNLAINGFPLLPCFRQSSRHCKAKISISCLCTTCNHHWAPVPEPTTPFH
jgi:hypothetical protein